MENFEGMACWLFGRGASIACGLEWVEPLDSQKLDREARIEKIKVALRSEMQKIPIGKNIYTKLLSFLEKNTKHDCKHLFITTNWDYLLQREILNLITNKTCPNWLIDSHVFHLNGSIEATPQINRSPFLLPDDSANKRESIQETNQALQYMIFARLFIVVGISFKYELDKRLLYFLQLHEDKLPFGEGKWIILDCDKNNLNDTCKCFSKLFPRIDIVPINEIFEEWINIGLPELIK